MLNTEPQITAAWITAIVAILSALITNVLQIIFRFLDSGGKRKQEVMQHRKEALFLGLQVIDHAYANTKWDDKPASNPHEWDITLARDAMNKMIIYCKDPQKTLQAFSQAVGLYNPVSQTRPRYNPGLLHEFRRRVCEELEIKKTNYTNAENIWIYTMTGAR